MTPPCKFSWLESPANRITQKLEKFGPFLPGSTAGTGQVGRVPLWVSCGRSNSRRTKKGLGLASVKLVTTCGVLACLHLVLLGTWAVWKQDSSATCIGILFP